MTADHSPAAGALDVDRARRAILRFQPASNWVATSRDPTQRMTVGHGFDVNRPDATELLRRVGLDPAEVRSGRAPISDAQMNELFELTLERAVGVARRRVPGFAAMAPERQWALLELIAWLGPDGTDGVLRELRERSLPLTHEPLEASQWFDVAPGSSSPRDAVQRTTRGRLRFESFGLVAELASDDVELLDAAEAMLPPGWRRAGERPVVVRFGLWSDGAITVDGARADRSPHRDVALLKLGATIRHHLATEAPGFAFVHAGVVEAGGVGIVIPGRSFTGKSRLVSELVSLGATYVSDEYAVLDESGVVHPFAKPISIRRGRHDPIGQLVPAPPSWVAEEPVRAGLIVLTAYSPGTEWRPSIRSRAEGAFALLQNTVSARLRPDAALRATSRLARDTVVIAGRRGEASDAARALLDLALLAAERSTTFPP
jgi:hypothetical protein